MKVHKCSGRNDVQIVKGQFGVDIVRGINDTFNDTVVKNITFCPFCGMNLKAAKK